MNSTDRLAIIATHPIQYQAPWFHHIQKEPIESHVFYLWDPSTNNAYDRGFERQIQWDVPLKEGYQFTIVPNSSSDPGTHHFWGLRNPDLRTRLTAFKPGYVLCLGYRYASIMNLLLHPLPGKPQLIIRGDSNLLHPIPPLKRSIKKLLLSTLFQRFAAALYVGEANKAYFKHYGFQDEQLFFCPHALNPKIFTSNDPSFRGDPLRLLFVGKLEDKKRPHWLLESFLSLSLPNAELHFVGEGPLKEVLLKKANGHPSIYFHGFKNQTELPAVYQSASLLVLPSLANESWGLVVQEAAMMGVPSLVSSTVGCAEDLIRERETGFIFDGFQHSSLSEALRQVSNVRATLPDLGENAKRHVMNYSYSAATAGLLSAIRYLQDSR